IQQSEFTRKLRIASAALELHHHANGELRFAAAKIGEPDTAASAAAIHFRRREIGRSRGSARYAGILIRGSIASGERKAGRSYAASPGKIRHVRVAISSFRPPCDVLLGHVLESDRAIPHMGLLARKLSEVR